MSDTIREFTGGNENNITKFFVKIKSESIEHINSQRANSGSKEINIDILMRRAIADSLPQLNIASQSEVEISIDDIDFTTDKGTYHLIKNHQVIQGEVALSAPKQSEIDQIVRNNIVSTNRASKPSLESLLERFAAPQPKTGLWASLKRFFSSVLENFRFLENMWESLTGGKAKKLLWDLKVLSEISGTFAVKGLSVYESLRYLKKMLPRQRKEFDDPALTKRIDQAIDLSKKLHHLRDSYDNQKCQQLIRQIRLQVNQLPENQAILLPVGFLENGVLHEMLIEVKHTDKDRFSVSLISGSPAMRALFDHQMGITTGMQSMRREIQNVKKEDLLGVIPSWVGLQVSPLYFHQIGTSGRSVFMQSLRFNQSTVAVGEKSHSFLSNYSTGHLREALAYVQMDKSIKSKEDAEQFDLAIQLRFLLDICKKNPRGLKNKEYWQQVRTICYQYLAHIDKNKQVLGKTRLEQGLELTKITTEIKALLDTLEKHNPEFSPLDRKKLPLFASEAFSSTVTRPPTPLLYPPETSEEMIAVNPPFTALVSGKTLESIISWGERIDNLVQAKRVHEASAEAKMMVRMLPNPTDTFWQELSSDDAKTLLKHFNSLGSAIGLFAHSQSKPHIHNALVATALNYYAFGMSQKALKDSEADISPFISFANKSIDDLQASTLSFHDKNWLASLQNVFGENEAKAIQRNGNLQLTKEQHTLLQPLINISQFTAMAYGVKGSPVIEKISAFGFKINPQGDQIQHSIITPTETTMCWDKPIGMPLPLSFADEVPDYAKKVNREVVNRYLTEYCPLGCIRDNCPNYNNIDKHNHRFYPLYMAHNYIEKYSPGLMQSPYLNRDEVIDLLYLQQTNQNAANLALEHGHTHGFEEATRFNQADFRIHAMHAVTLFLENPHFLNHKEFQWLFENKLFKQSRFMDFLDPQLFSEYQPFIHSFLKKLLIEIKVAKAEGKIETEVYLITIADQLKNAITHSEISNKDKDTLLSLLSSSSTKRFYKILQSLIGKTDSSTKSKLKILTPILINHTYQEVCSKNGNAFDDQQQLELFMYALYTIDTLKTDDLLDQETLERQKSLASLALEAIKTKMNAESSEDKGNFVNILMAYYQPLLTAKRLDWNYNSFPIIDALASDGTQYHFDLATGQVTTQNDLQHSLPNALKKIPIIESLYESKFDATWTVNETSGNDLASGVRSYSHPSFPGQRIVVKANNYSDPILERLVLNAKQEPEWFSYARFNAQDLYQKGESIQYSDLPPVIAAAIGERTCWIDREKTVVNIYDQGSAKPYAVMKLNTQLLENNLYRNMISSFQIIETGNYLLGANEKDLEQFTLMEDPSFIQVTGKKAKASTVNFTRLELAHNGSALTYQLNQNKVTTPLLPGYELAPYGSRPGKPADELGVNPLPSIFDHFHLFRKDGSEKLFISMRELDQLYSRKGEAAPLTLEAINMGTFEKGAVFEYSVNQETNRLEAKSSDAYAYLAYICGTHQDYASAIYYLNKARSSIGYDKRYMSIFEWAKKWDYQTTSGLALRLKFELFEERVLADQRISQIKKGEYFSLSEIDLNRSGRLSQIALIYERYCDALSKREIGITGLDPSLDLSQDEETSIKILVQELVKEHGAQKVNEETIHNYRAQEVPPLQSHLNDRHTFCGFNEKAVLLWAFTGNSHQNSTMTIQDPRWIIANFRYIFNQLIQLDKDSHEFKLLVQQIRLVSEIPLRIENKVQRDSIYAAQHYLLKLASGKIKNSQNYDQIVGLLPHKQLPNMQGTFFAGDRSAHIQRAKFIFSQFNQINLDHVKNKIEQIITKFTEAKKSKSNATPAKSNPDPYRLLSFAERAKKFIVNYEKRLIELKAQGAQPTKDFSEAFRDFALAEIFGYDEARTLIKFDSLIKQLVPIPIVHDVQKMAPSHKPTIANQTNQERFEKFVTKPPKSMVQAQIEQLETQIHDRITPPIPQKIKTDPTKITTVLDKRKANIMQNLFVVSAPPITAIDESIFDELSQTDDKAVKRLAEEHRKDMRKAMRDKRTISITQENAKTVEGLFKTELTATDAKKEQVKREILQLVENFQTAPAGIAIIRRLRGEGVKINLDYLINLWSRDEINTPWEKNPLKKLGLKEVPQHYLTLLDQKVLQYNQLLTQTQHINLALQAASNYLDSCKSGALGDLELARTFYESTTAQRYYAFDDEDSRDLLFMESRLGIILRQSQIKTIRTMLSDPNSVRQLGMGGGKSKVLLPMLAKKKANGKNLVILMLPDALYETNCRDLNQTNRELFGQEMHRFDFSISTNRSKESLQQIYLRLLTTIRDKGFIMTTKRSILSLRNSYIELFYKLEEAHTKNDIREINQLCDQIREMSKIMKLFCDQGDILADEVDACLDIRKELNFSIGKGIAIDAEKIEAGFEIMELILNAKENTPLHTLKTAIEKNTQAAMSPTERETMLEHVAKAVHAKYKDSTLKEVDESEFVLYITNKTTNHTLEHWVESLELTDPTVYKKLSSFKAMIDQGFSTTFNRIGGVNYGRDPKSGTWTIPWAASMTPNIGSEFDDDIERIAFTLQDYVQFGVTYQQVYRVVAQLRVDAARELRSIDPADKKKFNLNKTKAAENFKNLLALIDPGKKVLGNIQNLGLYDSPERIQSLTAAINVSSIGKLSFCKKLVLDGMQKFTTQINSVSIDVPDMVKHFSGFTGTPSNRHTFHDKINSKKTLGVDGLTWSLLLENNVAIKTFDFNPDKPAESVLEGLDVASNYQGIGDCGAYLRGISNAKVIDLCLKMADEKGITKAGIYFDETGKIVKKFDKDSSALPLENAPATDFMDNLTHYDQAHTVGSDIKQGAKAVLLVTIGEGLTVRELFQTVWRFRQVHRGQPVVFGVSNQIKALILKGESRDLTVKDILKYCLTNEARKESPDNFKAEKEKIKGSPKRILLPNFIDLAFKLTNKQLAEAAAATVQYLVKEKPPEKDYASYAKLKGEESPETVLKQFKTFAEKKCKEMSKALASIHSATAEKIYKKAAEIKDRKTPSLDLFPNKVVNCLSDGGGEIELEAEMEMETELELELEVETEEEAQVFKKEPVIPMASGNGIHGDVVPLRVNEIEQAICSGKVDTVHWPAGQRVGDVVHNATSTIPMDLLREVNLSIEFFDPGIFCSAVMERNLIAKASDPKPNMRSIFYTNRKPIKQVLIAKKSGLFFSNPLRMVIPTTHEAHAACKTVVNQAQQKGIVAIEIALSKGKPIVVYKSGDDRTDKLPFEGNELKQFYELYVQAKLFNGEIDFNLPEEKEALKSWLQRKDAAAFRDFFEQNILAARPKRFINRYTSSSLYEILEEACNPAAIVTKAAAKQPAVVKSPSQEKPEEVEKVMHTEGLHLEMEKMNATPAGHLSLIERITPPSESKQMNITFKDLIDEATTVKKTNASQTTWKSKISLSQARTIASTALSRMLYGAITTANYFTPTIEVQ